MFLPGPAKLFANMTYALFLFPAIKKKKYMYFTFSYFTFSFTLVSFAFDNQIHSAFCMQLDWR